MLDQLAAALAERYRIYRELGRGGMATVYLAEDLKHHRQVAIKVLDPSLSAAVGVDRFLREIEIAAGLRHPHVVPLYDSGVAATGDEEPERPSSLVARPASFLYYVMPYIKGESLRARLDREHQLPIDDALRIAREVVDALSYAHGLGVIHRDIKPENILLESGHAVVADFGIAKAITAAGPATALTGIGMSVGTPAYMSPEQAAGDSDVDGRSDLYSLACVVYEMLTGQPPFTGATAESLVRQHITVPPAPVTQFRPAVAPPVADAIARALSKVPADRFSQVDQFATALSAPSAPSLPVASQPSASSAAWRARRPLLLGAIAVLAAIAVFLLPRADKADAAHAPRIAVLPLDDLSGDTSNSPLALGMQEEIITELTRLADVEVTARSSTMDYGGRNQNVERIGRELRVTHVLAGSMQRAGEQVRLTFQLVDVASRRQLWAERFDRGLTAANLLALQTEVSQLVTAALGARLRGEGAKPVARPGTENLAALDLYYEANRVWNDRGGFDAHRRAGALLERAVAMDSSYGAAWALLSVVRSWALRLGETNDTLPAFDALSRAERLAPKAVEAMVARGYYHYWGFGDLERGRAAFAAAVAEQPTANLVHGLALLERRLGRWDQAIELLERAARLDPRNPSVLLTVGETYAYLERFDDALRTNDRALALGRGNTRLVMDRASTLFGRGDTAGVAALIATMDPGVDTVAVQMLQYYLAVIRRRYADAAALVDTTVQSPWFAVNGFVPELELAFLSRLRGDSTAMRSLGARVVARADSVIGVRQSRPGDPFGNLAEAEMVKAFGLALRGDAAAGTALGERVYARYPLERDAIGGARNLTTLAQLYLITGRYEAALDRLEESSRHPAGIHAGYLRVDPSYDPLRANPRFRRLTGG